MFHYVVNTYHRKYTIRPEIYGNFSEHLGRCIYGGIYVGEDSPIPNQKGIRTDVVQALRKIHLPVLRWPGGCFADEYHWKDGIGEKKLRKKMVNTHWGGVVEDNSFGTHEFMEFCRQVGCQPYINGNVGSGTVEEMQQWIEYMTFDGQSPMSQLRRENGQEQPWKLKYFGVGNENWGCGGNMRPEFYADTYRRYATYLRNFGDNKLYKIACGPNSDDYNWTEQLMKIAGKYCNAITMHYYTNGGDAWNRKVPATGFDQEYWYRMLHNTLKMDEMITKHLQIMDRYDPEHKVDLIVDEWGSWYQVEPGTNPGFLYQQNTIRDALIAGINLNIFNKHSDRIAMANIAQMVNVLQAVILTEGEKMILTPTYHVFDLYQVHQNATLVDSWMETKEIGPEGFTCPNLHESASIGQDDTLHLTLCNLSADQKADIETTLVGEGYQLKEALMVGGNMGDYNTFKQPEAVTVKPLTSCRMKENGRELSITLPPCTVARISLAPVQR